SRPSAWSRTTGASWATPPGTASVRRFPSWSWPCRPPLSSTSPATDEPPLRSSRLVPAGRLGLRRPLPADARRGAPRLRPRLADVRLPRRAAAVRRRGGAGAGARGPPRRDVAAVDGGASGLMAARRAPRPRRGADAPVRRALRPRRPARRDAGRLRAVRVRGGGAPRGAARAAPRAAPALPRLRRRGAGARLGRLPRRQAGGDGAAEAPV